MMSLVHIIFIKHQIIRILITYIQIYDNVNDLQFIKIDMDRCIAVRDLTTQNQNVLALSITTILSNGNVSMTWLSNNLML